MLADDATIAAFGQLMDVATLATPNLPELRRLTGEEDEVAAALKLVSAHRCAVLIKGGHEEGDALADALIEEDNITSWQGQRIDTTSTHGTGCTLASGDRILPRPRAHAAAGGRARAASSCASRSTPRRGWGRAAARSGRQTCGSISGSGMPRQPGHGDRQGLCQDRSLSTAASGCARSSTARKMRYARFETGGGATLSIQVDPEETIAQTTAIYFECDDLDARVERLARLGIAVRTWPAQPAVDVARGAAARSVGQYDLPLQGGRSAPLPAVADGNRA